VSFRLILAKRGALQLDRAASFVVAILLRILQDFASFCRAKSFIFFAVNPLRRAHNPKVGGLNPLPDQSYLES
jgi:hypothetical protein